MGKIRVGINGFGRIGRGFVRALAAKPDAFDLALINDLTDAESLAHLLKYDSVHGRYPGDVDVKDNLLVINGDAVNITAEKDPANIPWSEYNVDIVLECTGRFVDRENASKHLGGSVKKVLISAPAKSPDITLACGINLGEYKPDEHNVISNASCTTNCLAPMAKVLQDTFGIVTGMMTTIHSYTNDQRILDLPHKDRRRSRAAAVSMIPTTTGAAKAIALVLPELSGKLDGMAIRVPTPNVSLVDLTVVLEKDATAESINQAFKEAAEGELKGVLGVSDELLVSIDYNGNPNSATVDLAVTNVNGKQAKVMGWYDNEAGYSQRLFDLAEFVASKL